MPKKPKEATKNREPKSNLTTHLGKRWVVYTDGACSGNPGPGGFGCVITDGASVVEVGGHSRETTNNRMELQALLEALKFLQDRSPEEVQIYTDSVYVIRGATQWIWGWSKRSWRNSEGKDVLNQDLWKEYLTLAISLSKKKLKFHYCRGHQGTPGNERCDEIAVDFSKRHRPSLFAGSIEDYSVEILPPPPPQKLPEMKSQTKVSKAYSYLSVINGKLVRHNDWKSCESRVKGQSGAKFKKAANLEEERQILRSWGLKLDPSKL